MKGSKDGNILFNDALHTFYLQLFGVGHIVKESKEGNVLFNGTLNTFYLWLYGIGHIVKDHLERDIGNPLLLLNGLLFLIKSKGSFICTIPQTG